MSQPNTGPTPEEIAERFWGRRPVAWRLSNGEKASEISWKAYFDYYRRQWQYFSQEGSTCFAGFEELSYAVEQLAHGVTQEELIQELRKRHQTSPSQPYTDEVFRNSIMFAARAVIMLRLGWLQHEVHPDRSLSWESGSLRDFVDGHFDMKPQLGCDNIRLVKSFDGWSLENIGGVKIEFTDNLADHLRLVDDDKVVRVFHHASFLEYQNHANSLLPAGLAKETLSTLALLFPQAEFDHRVGSSKRKRRWMKSLCDSWADKSGCRVDRRITSCGTLPADRRQIENFHHWRDRLVILKQTYDDETPRTVRQWWYDRRNGSQWYPFWIALMVFIVATVLGLVQCVEGALQVYRAYYPPPNS